MPLQFLPAFVHGPQIIATRVLSSIQFLPEAKQGGIWSSET